MEPLDIHAHLFNLRYLPVGGIIRRYSSNVVSRGVSRGAEWFLWRITASSFLPGDDSITQDEMQSSRHAGLSPAAIKKMDKEELADLLTSLAKSEDIVGTHFGAAIDEYIQIHSVGIEPHPKLATRINPLYLEEFAIVQVQIKGFWEWLMDIIEDGVNHFRWFAIMLNGEEYLFNEMKIDNDGVNDYVHHLMDVDHFFTDDITGDAWPSYYEFYPTQVKRMRKLQENHARHLRGFVAFNPCRPDAIKIIENSVNAGFNGVKFYPPMGYKPIDDSNVQIAERINELINFCASKNIPLFTHCNNSGFEAFPKKDSGYCSNPVYWEKVLKQHNTLRLCLGHGGGGEGWFAKNKPHDEVYAANILASNIKDKSADQMEWNQSYAAMVFKLCVLYDNVYCDFSYLDDMIKPDGTLDAQKRTNFRTRLLKLLKAAPEFANKFMYGSDWHMLYREKKQGVYYAAYNEFFNDPELKIYRERFFTKNALTYLA